MGNLSNIALIIKNSIYLEFISIPSLYDLKLTFETVLPTPLILLKLSIIVSAEIRHMINCNFYQKIIITSNNMDLIHIL